MPHSIRFGGHRAWSGRRNAATATSFPDSDVAEYCSSTVSCATSARQVCRARRHGGPAPVGVRSAWRRTTRAWRTMFLTVPAAFMGDERTGVGGRDSAR
eukprot:scaffold90296_cov68-Phaeocystis_antarctica.AAC.11